MNPVQDAISKLVEKKDLTTLEATRAMKCIMSGEASPAQIGGFLATLRLKGETISEITAFAKVMRDFAARINPRVKGVLVDTCGTGGDKIKTFNVSTAVSLVAAGAGVPIAKHGNRSVTSKSGSADVLEALGVKIDLDPGGVERCIQEIGYGFMFAPVFHKAMRHALPVRKEVGIRTVFNVLGPLTNPANARAQVLGVYDVSFTVTLAKVLNGLGVKRAMVVHGLAGLDEISTLGPTQISELKGGKVKTYTVTPEEFGIRRTKTAAIVGSDVEENARMLLRVLKCEEGPHRDVVLLNAAAAIMVGGKASDIKKGLKLAAGAIDSGKAYEKLAQLVQCSGGDSQKLKMLEASL